MAGSLPTASPPVLSLGGTGAHFNYEVWEDSFHGATYQELLALARFYDLKRPYSKNHTRNAARLLGNSMASTDVGTGLLYQNPVGPEVTTTPAANYVATAWAYGEAMSTDVPLDQDLATEMQKALAEASETSACAQFAALSQNRGAAGTDIVVGSWRNALGLLTQNTNGAFSPGQSEIYGILDASQYNAVMSIPEFTHADIRGDGENPQVRGIWSKGGGAMLMLSTALTTDPNGTHGCIWVRSAFGVAWNDRSTVLRQRLEAQNRLICLNNFGTSILHDLRAVGISTGNVIGS